MSVNLVRKAVGFRYCFHRSRFSICSLIILQILLLLVFIHLKYRYQDFGFINVGVPYPKYNETELKRIEASKKCFLPAPNYDGIVLLPDFLENKVKPKPGKGVFFQVTTCQSNGSVILNPRQACAIESAAKWNPNRDIFVLFAAPVGLAQNDKTVPPIIKALQSYANIHLRNVDIIKHSIGTLGETWIKTDRIYLSKFIVAHMSDYLRFLTLYKFGGIYFDLDVIVLKNLDEMPPNFSGVQDGSFTAIGAIGFEPNNVGHKIIEMIFRENTENYKPEKWADSSVLVMTQMVKKICRTNNILETKPEFCWGFKVFPASTFYPLHWTKNHYLFSSDPKIMNESFDAVKDSITVHAWNNATAKVKIDLTKSKTVYAAFAEINCPKVYGSTGQYF